MKMMNKFCALMLSVALCAGMAAPAFAYGGEPVEEAEQPVLTSTTDEEDAVTVTDEESGTLTPEGNLTLVDDYHTSYSDGSGQQFITLVSKSGNTFYLVIDRNDKGENTVHFMNLVDESDLLSLMEEDAADAYTAEKEAAAQAAQERKQAEEDAKKAAEEAEVSGSEQTGGNKVTKYAATFLGVLALVGLVAGGGIYTFMKQKQKKQAEKEALDPDANYTEDKGDFEIPVEEVEQPVLTSTTDEEDVVTVTDEETGALTPEGNLTMVDDYHTSYSDGSGQQFITLVSKSGNTFYLVIDRNAKGQQTVHFMNLVDEADLLALMEEDAADAYTAEKKAAAQAEQDRLKAEEEAKKAAGEAAASGSEQTKVTKYATTFLGVLALVGLVAGGGIYTFMKQKQKKQAEKEALDPDANYTEDKGDFEIPTEDEPEEPGEEDTEPI